MYHGSTMSRSCMGHTYIWDKSCPIFRPDSSMILISDSCIDLGKVFVKILNNIFSGEWLNSSDTSGHMDENNL